MNHVSVESQVLFQIRQVTGAKEIDLDRPLADYDVDSIAAMELVMDLERKFNISIPDEKIESLLTPRAVVELVNALLTLHVS